MEPIIIKKYALTYIPVWVLLIPSVLLIVFGTGKWCVSGFILLAFDFYFYMHIRSIQWILSDTHVLIKYGVMPWQRYFNSIPKNKIFGCGVTKGFWGHYMNYATITLRLNDGTTTEKTERYMQGALQFVEQINGANNTQSNN